MTTQIFLRVNQVLKAVETGEVNIEGHLFIKNKSIILPRFFIFQKGAKMLVDTSIINIKKINRD